jgi:hypothetical protein
MVLWVKRCGALSGNLLLMVVIYRYGHAEAAAILFILTMAWVTTEWLAPPMYSFLHSLLFVANAWFSAYAVLSGASVELALLVVACSLLWWNAGLFLRRWGEPPLKVQFRYLRRVGSTLVLGLGIALFALRFQGHISVDFPLALLLMVVAGGLCLRIISLASLKKI